MPLLAILNEAAHSALPSDEIKALYKQNTENKDFYLDIAPAQAGMLAFDLQASVRKLEENSDKMDKELKNVRARVKPFEELGKTAEEMKAALESNQPADVAAQFKKYEDEKIASSKSYEEALQKEREMREKAQGQTLTAMREAAITGLVREFNLTNSASFMLEKLVQFELDDDGKVVQKILDPAGSEFMVTGQKGDSKQLIAHLREAGEYPELFKVPNGGGGGADPTQRGSSGGDGKTIKRSEYVTKAQSDPQGMQKFFADGGKVVDD